VKHTIRELRRVLIHVSEVFHDGAWHNILLTCSKRSRWTLLTLEYFSFKFCRQRVKGYVTVMSPLSDAWLGLRLLSRRDDSMSRIVFIRRCASSVISCFSLESVSRSLRYARLQRHAWSPGGVGHVGFLRERRRAGQRSVAVE
jgi:hypothetical protein